MLVLKKEAHGKLGFEDEEALSPLLLPEGVLNTGGGGGVPSRDCS